VNSERIDGEKLYYAFVYGGRRVLKKRKHLNDINVFPVPDGDTGTNLAATMQAIMEGVKVDPSVSTVSQGMAQAALLGSRGNSGIIFAQFVQGMSEAIEDNTTLSVKEFVLAVKRGVDQAYKALSKPVEGTILTIMKTWSQTLHKVQDKAGDYRQLIHRSMSAVKAALKETPKRLHVLREAGVVDAGAEGFVHFLEGVMEYFRHEKKPEAVPSTSLIQEEGEVHFHQMSGQLPYRYCTEGLLTGDDVTQERIQNYAGGFGDSLILAGTDQKRKIHIHTNTPWDLHYGLREMGVITRPKVDDMQRQYDVQYNRKAEIALVTDSACDVPRELQDAHQIHIVPIHISFGESEYLDKATLIPDHFYRLLDEGGPFPQTSQPNVKIFQNLYTFLLSHYESILSMHLSSALSGTWNAAKLAAESVDKQRIAVIDSKTLSTALGLMVQRIATRIEEGKSFEEVVRYAETLPEQAGMLVSVKTLKYMVMGGRVSPLKGLLAKMLNLKPIVSLDEKGAATRQGKAFSTKTNVNKIMRMVEARHAEKPIETYAIGHARAQDEAEEWSLRLTEIIGCPPSFILDIAPVIGAHAGVGALSVTYL
jgi:DegV family protein with EDD domain